MFNFILKTTGQAMVVLGLIGIGLGLFCLGQIDDQSKTNVDNTAL